MAIQATQTTGQVIGFVRQVIGEVKATGSDGVTRILQVGDLVFADEQIATGELGSIEIVFNDGGNLTLGRNSQGLLDADVYQTTTPEDGSEYAASIDAIQQAILLGEDPTAIQEAPAAGPGDSPTGNEGSSFVTVERTGAQTTPESGFETAGLTISFAQSDESSTIIDLLPTIDLDGDDNSQVGVGYLSHFTENGDPLPIADADIQVSNPDGTVLESARIVLTNAQFGDQLDVSAITGLNVEVDSSVPGVITVLLSGTATPQVYAQAIRDIGFINTTDNPDETPRIIEVTVNDGEFDSNTAVTTITVQAVNDPPVIDLDSNDSTDSGYDYLTTFTEGESAISIADFDAAVSDVDDETLQSATVTLTNPQSGDVLAFGNMPAGLSAVVDGHTITISGEASLADYQSAIQAITFENTSQNPSPETRLIQVTVNDGELDSDIAVARIEVVGVNDVAVIDLDSDDSSAPGNGYETTFIEDGSAVSIVDEDVVITDVDDTNIESATIILTNHQSFDQLIVRGLPIGITATVDDISVTLTGTASLADYEQALQAIHFVNTSDYPQTVDRIINITINDGDGNSDTAVSIIHVIPVNDPPDAENDIVATQENTPVGIFVLGNDSDPEGDRLLVTGNTQPSNGTLVQNSNGSYQYTPNAGFTGTDSFTYTVSDGNGGFDTATVMIAVAGVNDGPVAIGDSASTNENTPTTIDVLTNDSDPEGDVLSITSVTQGTNGSVTIDPVTGNPIYTPAPTFTGIDTFTYTITDGNGGTDTATVTVTVGGVNDAPVAIDDTVGTNEDTPVTVDVLPNDSDPDGDTLTVTTVTQGTNGSVAIDPVSGNPVYTPNADFNGTDTFTYTIDDGNGGTDTATVTVTVGAVNDAPVAVDDSIGTDEDVPVTVNVLPNDSDPDGDALTVIAITQGSNGSVTIDPISGNPVYTPNTNFIGTDTFTYTIDDGNGGTDTATVTVNVGGVNDAPIATDDAAGTNEDTPVTVEVLPNDSDPDGDTLTVTAVTQGANGSVSIDPVTGNPVYTPNPDFNGTDTFTYTIDDGNGGTDTATVTVTVGAVNDAPVAVDDSIGTDEDLPVTVNVLPNDSDPDGDALTVIAITQGSNGSVTIDPISGNPVYTPNTNFIGTDTFTYTIDDGNGGTDTATVTVTVGAVNDVPIATDDTVGTNEDTPVTVDVLPNDSDPDGDVLTVTAVTQGANGSVAIDPVSGNPVYTPDPDFNGTDTFTYTIDDGNGGTDTATVTVTVGAVNDAPIATDDAVGTNEDTPVTVDVLPNDSDPDGDTLTVTAVTQGTNGTVMIDPVSGNPIYTPDADFNGTDTFTYTIDDGNGGTDTATVTVTVGAVNDAPIATDDAVGTNEDTPVTVDVLPNDSDPDGDTLTVTAVTQGTNGTVTIDPVSGNPIYTPDADFNGTDTFTYTIDDGNGGTDTATVTVTVGAVNDAPIATDDAVGTNEDTPVTVDVLPNDSDPDGDTLTVTAVTQGTNGSVSIDPVSGNPVYTPDPDFNGTDTFTYTIDDGNGGTDTATVTVTVGAVNDVPVAVDDSIGTDEDVPVTVNVLPNDSDPDGDTLTVTAVTQGTNGTVTIDPVSGNPIYTPDADFNGTDTFTYTIDDGNGGTDTATVTVTVGAVNDAPIATDDAVGTNEDTPVTVDVLPNDSDPDGDTLTVTAVTQGTNGSVSIDPVSGNPVYTPDPDFNGTDTFTYTIDDGNGGTDTATVTVTVGAVNDAPIATDDTVGTNEDTPVTVDVLPNDSDPDGDTLTVTAVTQGTNGSVTIDPVSGNPVYTPDADFNGTDTFTYTIDDGNGGTDTATVTVTVGAVNDAPVAVDDSIGTDEDVPVTVNVLPNDSDPDGDTLTVTAVTQGTNGTVTIDPVSGNPIYTPDADFNGTDTFTYTIDDGNGGTDTATVTVTVGAVNDAPVAVDDAIDTDEDVSVTVDVLPNDSDPDGDTLTVTAVTQGANGSVAIDPVSGNPVYTPDPDFNGTDTFTYTIDDGNGGTDTATVTVTVGAVNDAPVATDDTVGTNEDTPVTVDVLPNDSDPDGDTLTVTAVTQGTNGSVSIDPVSGNPVYTPNADFNGTDTFTYTIDDGNGGTDTATVTVTVGAVNDAPVATDDTVGTNEDTPVTVDVLPNDSDPDGDALTVTAVTQGTNGSVAIDPVSGNPVYTPNADFNGTDTFTYTIDDGNGGTDTATVTVTVGAVNDAPIATDDAVGTNEDTPVTVDVLPNDSDPDGDTLTVTAVTQGTNGTVTIDPVSGNPIYTPDADFNGTDTFTYTIDDGNGGTDTATVTVTVGAVNDAPIATDDAVGTNEDTPVTVDVLPNDSDPDGDTLTVTAVTQGTNGTVTIDPVSGNPIYTPDADFNGTDTFTYTIDDGNGGTDTATVTVTVGAVNDAPVAVDDSIGTDEDVPVTVNVLPNDSDPDGDTLTVTAVTQGTNGTVTIDPVSGNPIYTPDADFNGTDTFTYTIDDGNGGTDTATVTVTVGAVNDAPIATDDTVGTNEDTPVTVDVLPNDSDPDGDVLTVTAVTQGTNGSVSIDPVSGNPVYTPNADFNGTDTFTYTIDDGNGGTDTATVTVTVGAVNDAPVAVDDSIGTDEDVSVTVDVLPNDSDPDGDVLTVTAVTQGTNGSVAIDPVSGNPVYTPDPDFNGTDTFTYTIDDGNGGTDTATVTVTVGAVNDAPVAVDDSIGTDEDVPVTVNVLPNDSDPDGDALTITAVTQGTNGSVSIDPVSGNPVYTPNADFNGTDTFTYTIDDGNGGTDTATVTVTVGAVNDAPIATDDAVGTNEDTPVTVDVLPNDSDPDGDLLTVTAVTQGTNGTVTIDPVSGNPIYTPDADFNGTDIFTYTIDDGNGGTDTATVTVTVGAVNDAPVAVDDSIGTDEDVPVIVNVLPNDSDPDGDTLTVTAVTQGTNGSVAIDPVSGNPVYTPNPDFNGTDTFTYTIDDGNGGTDTATVTVTVGAVNDAPIATDDAVGTNEDTPVTVDVLPNDSDPDGDTLTVTAVTQGTNGTVTIDPVSGNPIYTPDADFNGTDTFTYTIDDGNGGTDTATVTITVGAVNDAPVAVDDSIGTDEDVPVTVNVLPNDSDPDGDTLTVTAVTQGTNGTVTIDPVSGNPIYTPDVDFNGTDTFTYTIDDGNGGTDTATVTVTVGAVNDAPIATDDAVGTNEDTPVTVDVLPNDSDPDGDTLTVTAVTQGTNGTVTIDPVSGNPIYTPNADFNGTDTFTYTIDDGNGGTDTATVTVTVGAVNDAPVAVDDSIGTDEDVPVTVNVLPNDSDPDGDALTVTAVTQGTNGSVSIDPVSGNPVYTPNADFNGTDTFTYTIDDGNGGTDTATVTVTVGAVNDAPVAVDDSIGTDEDVPVTVNVLPNDSDPDGDVLTITAVTQGTNGSVSIDPVSGNPVYTPNADFNGTDTFTYTIDDGNGGTDTATVTVTVGAVNDAPIATDDAVGTNEDTPVTVDVLPNDSDPDGDTLTVTAVTQGTNGTVTIDPVSGNPIYTPNADFNGTDTFTYTIDDGNGGTDTATVTITVGAVNDAPIATDDAVGTNEDTPVTVDVLPNDSDPDGDTLTVTAVTQGTNGSVSIDPVSGNPVYTPNADFNGTDTFTYTIDDGNGGTDTATVTVTVGAVNDAPIATDDTVGTNEDTPVTVDVLPNDSDPDGDVLTITAVTQGTNGSVSIDPVSGNPVYTPNADFNGTDTFTYTIDDGNGGTDTATVTVTVGAVNDAPIATDDAVGTNEDTPVTVDVLPNDSDPDGDLLTVTAVTQGTNGSVSIDPVSGNPVYTPNADFNGTDTFTYTIDDGNGGTDTATVTVTVGAVNDAPIATDDAVGTNEDTPVTVDVLPNDSDPDGDTLTVTAVTQGTNGTVTIDPVSGNPIYTPDADFNGTDTFTYTIDDGNGGTDTATVTVTVGAVNDAPIATDDAVGTNEDTPVTVDVLPNDSDPDGDLLTVTAVTQGTNGSVSIDPVSGNPVYTPNADFNGTDTFTYTIDDGNGGTDTATVTVTVGAVNDAPIATDDAVGTNEDTPVTVDVLPNDSDPDGDLLTVTAVTQGTNGSVSIDPVSGNPVYTPNADFNGTDTFTYTIDDGNGGTDTATVTVTVGAVNDAPIATDDAVGTNEDTPVTVDVLPNDSDPDGDTLTVTAVTQGTNGTVTIDPVSGNPIYTPDADFNGTDTFTYTIDDGNGGTDTATVTVTVGAVNDAPIATDDTVGTNEDTPVTVDVLPNDSDPDGDTLTVTAVTQGTNGSVAIDPISGNPVYTPDPDFNGTDTFTYTIDDGNGGTDTASVTVTVGAVNDAPVATDDTVGTNEDTPVTVDVLPNDSDPDGDVLTVTAVTQGTNGSVVIDPVSGNPVYTPDPDFNGTDTFTYTIDDGNGGTDTATVTITVGAVNDAPIATDDAVGTNEDTPVTVDVLPNDSDPDGDTLTVTAVTQGTNGTVTIDPVSGNPIYTPDADFNGTDTFTYTIDDGNGGTDTATVTVTVGAVNDAPIATDDTVGTNEDTPVTVDVLPNDSDPDGDTLTVTAVTQGTNGSVAIDPISGNPVYTPDPDFNGTDTFTYTIDDGNGGTDTASVTVTVGAVNDAPVATDDTVGTNEDTPVTVDVLPNDSDPDGDVLTVTAVTQGTNGSVVIDPVSGNPVYTPDPDFNGTDTFTYTIDDGNGGTDTATVTITVGAVNDAPIATDDAVGTNEDTPVTVDVLPNDSDPDGDTLTVTAVTQGTNGTVTIDPVSGNPIYTPDADFNGTDTFTYTIDDGNGGTDTATVTVTVGAVNDAPVAVDDSIGTDEDVPVTVNVLPNDSDPDGDTLTVTAVTQGTNGSVAIDPVSGNPVYTPDPDFNGTDTFTYTIDDGNGGTDTATVTVTVGAVNDAPVAVDDAIDTDEDVSVTVDVLPNDSDPDGDTLTVTAVTQGANGSVAIDPVSGNPVYTPDPDFNGTDTFTYTIDDGNGGTDTATVTVTVKEVNDLPEITPATAAVSEEGLVNGMPDNTGTPTDTTDSVTDSGSMSVSDPEGDTLTVSLTEPGVAMTSYGQPITWTGDGTDLLIGSAGGSEVLRISIDQAGNYTVTLSDRVDHPVVGQEDVISFDVDVTVDDGTDSVSAPLTIQLEDDAPKAGNISANIYIGVDSLGIQNLAAGWTNPVFINGTGDVTQQDTDTDGFIDNLLWGSVPSGGSQSGYSLVDNPVFTGGGESVLIGESFKLADFSHNNWPIYSNSSTLDQVTLTIEMDVVVNDIPTTVQFDVLMDHNETPNNGADPRDIITLPAQAVTFSIGGQEYEVRVDGFMDANGQIVSTIRTDEQAVNPFEIMGSIVSTDTLPVVTGSVSNITGGDGSVSNVIWGDTTSPYGNLTVDSSGAYSFQLNRDTKDDLAPGDTITDTFSYSITDEDGDISSATLTITIGGYQSIDGSALADILRGTAADEYLSGYEGNDTLRGRGGDDVLDGGSGSDQLRGGGGNDTLIFDSADSLITGNAGFDTLIAPDNDDLDFSSISNIRNIERIDLTVGNHDILNLSVTDVLTMTDNDNLLEVLGDTSDSVELTNDWHESGNSVTQNGHTFIEYLNTDDSVTLLIEDQVNVTIL